MPQTVTMDDIANQAGVSKYAVSKALSGQSGVSEKTRERILKIATDLGYFNQRRVKQKYAYQRGGDADRRLRITKKTVMVLMPNIRMQSLDSSYWGRIIDGIAEEAHHHNLSMILTTEHSEDNLADMINVQGLLGVIVVGTISTSLLLAAQRIGGPLVMVDHEDASLPCDTLFVNNLDASHRITSHLIQLGHRQFQFVGDIRYARSFRERWTGFRLALEENDLTLQQDERLLHVTSMIDAGAREFLHAALNDLLRENRLAGALVCANDDIAVTAMQILRELGVTVPERISVTGFDNIEESSRSQPPLTTVNVVKEALGRRAVEMLIRRARQPLSPVERVSLFVETVARQSTAAFTPIGNVIHT